MAATEVAASDVIKLMLQFCKENSLQRTMQVLQEESGTTMNTVESVDSFISDINNGRWDSVLSQILTLSLPQAKLVNLYEQVRACAWGGGGALPRDAPCAAARRSAAQRGAARRSAAAGETRRAEQPVPACWCGVARRSSSRCWSCERARRPVHCCATRR
jgi:hypothetical protein